MAEKKQVLIKDFSKGWVTELKSDFLDPGMSPELENVDFGASGSVKKDYGYVELSSDDEDAAINRLMIVPDRQGVEWCFKKVGTKIKVYDSVMDRWDTVIESLTDGDVPVYEYFDAVVYFISAVDTAYEFNLFRYTRLTADVAEDAATVNVDDTTAFGATGNFYLNGTAVAYTGKTGTSFTGCTGTPAAEDNSLVFGEAVDKGGANEIPKGTVTAQFAGRLWVADGSTLYASKLVDLDNFAVAGSGTGDAIEKTVESRCTALKVFYNDSSELVLLAFTDNNKIYALDVLDNADLSSTITTLSLFKDNVSALNQLSTLVGPNNLYHIDFRNQVRSLGQVYANNGVDKVYSDKVSKYNATLFKTQYNFANARSVIYGDEYWCICEEGSSGVNNRIIIYDFEAGTWRKRTNINASDIAIYNKRVIFSNAVTNQVFEFKEELMSDNDAEIYFRYDTPDLDLSKLNFEQLRRVRIAGFMSKACVSNVRISSDFNTKELGNFTLSGEDTNITGNISQKEGTFGSMIWGDEMAGGDQTGLGIRFFVADLELKDLPELENFRLSFTNNQSNVYFEITAIKPFILPMVETYWPINKIIKTN